jgi:hypothetical protein
MSHPAHVRRGEEKRRHTRVELAGELHVRGASDATWFPVHARDLSASGFGFESAVAFERGEEVYLWLPESGVGVVPATVRHVAGQRGAYIIGVELDDHLPYEIEAALTVSRGR